MMYNLAAIFDDTVHQNVLAFAKNFQEKHDCEFEYTDGSIPHATLVKYEAESDPFTALVQKEFEVTLSGLTLLPSRTGEDGGLWVEISVLIPQQLRLLVSDLTDGLDAAMIRSEVGDLLRPHLTVCKLRSWQHIDVSNLDPTLFRASNVKVKLQVGESGTGFAYTKI